MIEKIANDEKTWIRNVKPYSIKKFFNLALNHVASDISCRKRTLRNPVWQVRNVDRRFAHHQWLSHVNIQDIHLECVPECFWCKSFSDLFVSVAFYPCLLYNGTLPEGCFCSFYFTFTHYFVVCFLWLSWYDVHFFQVVQCKSAYD
jgi:hypothetical protein